MNFVGFVKKLLTFLSLPYIIVFVDKMQRKKLHSLLFIMQEWRNWQTRRLQVPVVAISCGFKSHFLHFLSGFSFTGQLLCLLSKTDHRVSEFIEGGRPQIHSQSANGLLFCSFPIEKSLSSGNPLSIFLSQTSHRVSVSSLPSEILPDSC